MATVFATFDNDGDDLSIVAIPETIELEHVVHWMKYSYAIHADSTDEPDVLAAVDTLAQVHVIDIKNGV